MTTHAPPRRGAKPASGGFTSAEAKSQTEQLTRIAHATLADCGMEMAPSKVSRLVRSFQHRVAGNGWSFFEFFANATILTTAQRRQALANPDVARTIAYADPTGELAVANVMREASHGR